MDDRQIMDAINQLSGQMFEIQNRLDFLYKKLNVEYVEEKTDIDPRLLDAIKKGNMMEAYTLYRAIYNCDLAASKIGVGALLKRPQK